MARRKRQEEQVNHERWLVSYADFITLLFAFFVVMYSISSVNEGKYRVLSDSMTSAFRSSNRSLEPIQVGELVRAPRTAIPSVLEAAQPVNIIPVVIARNSPVVIDETVAGNSTDPELLAASEEMNNIAEEVTQSLDDFIENDEVSLRQTPLWLEVEINSNILFASGSAVLSGDAEEILSQLGIMLSEYPNSVHVEGFTDNRPIQNSIYPSNWELSSARAAAVVRMFQGYGVEPIRLASVGYGEFRPTTDNDSEESRASNRRVVVVIMANISNESESGLSNDMELFRQRLSN